jgi:hypothetical protein
MKRSWIAAALVSSALLVGCGGRPADNAQNPEQNQPASTDQTAAATEQAAPPAVTEPAPATSSSRDASGVTDRGARPRPSRATSGQQPASEAPRIAAAPRAEEPVRAERETRAAAAPAPEAPVWHEVTVAAGTSLPLELQTPLSSETATVETPVRARLRQAVTVDGYQALPAGAVLTGVVTEVERAGRVQGRSHLAFRFDNVTVNGDRDDLRTNPVTFEGEATKGEDATKVGAGAVGGAIIGGILGGGKGAAKGATVGAAAGTGAVLATRGREVTLASGADITATLATPFETRVR